MTGVFEGFATIAIIIAVGALLAHWGVVDESGQRLLGRLAFTVGIPALLVSMLADADPRAMLSATTGVTFLAILLSMLAYAVPARLVWRRGLGHTVVGSLDVGLVNSANLGIPIASFVLGDPTLVVPVMLLQSVVLQPISMVLLDQDATPGPLRLGRTLRDTLTNPITVGTVIGLTLGVTHTALPRFLDAPIQLLGGLAIPAMLLAYGVSLRLTPGLAGGENRGELTTTVSVKLLGQPLLALLIGLAADLPATALFTVVVIGALPTAQNIYITALRYGRAVALTRDTILLTTVGSVPIILLAAATLG